ncbi:hypothetical protein PAAG_11442 [Paracoccidioides lutzii Pb01]|uniref:Uncharacterized protein n=1 Tax=Paracoccidioides lutzii (strain ATCC MYA-826 / Pb01) TaxID=502779 RepID=A0A0A2V238_PARBA|nr:hypothetical protein PAAG_11442 [Paracoccidioides lutzii Pb01]KGQ01866.1 hypothetical protein PAAG_11442 [Paracoccidioides lutzii Pb01]
MFEFQQYLHQQFFTHSNTTSTAGLVLSQLTQRRKLITEIPIHVDQGTGNPRRSELTMGAIKPLTLTSSNKTMGHCHSHMPIRRTPPILGGQYRIEPREARLFTVFIICRKIEPYLNNYGMPTSFFESHRSFTCSSNPVNRDLSMGKSRHGYKEMHTGFRSDLWMNSKHDKFLRNAEQQYITSDKAHANGALRAAWDATSRGVVLLIASIADLDGVYAKPLYAASKCAVVGYMRSSPTHYYIKVALEPERIAMGHGEPNPEG